MGLPSIIAAIGVRVEAAALSSLGQERRRAAIAAQMGRFRLGAFEEADAPADPQLAALGPDHFLFY